MFSNFPEVNNGNLKELNHRMNSITGLNKFFKSVEEYYVWKEWYEEGKLNVGGKEFGDYQTSDELADKVCDILIDKGIMPTVVIEPTFGKGNFIFSAIKKFPSLKKVYGIEVQKSYEMYFKKRLLNKALSNDIEKSNDNMTLEIYRENFFEHIFSDQVYSNDENLLVLGNPPWITNTELGSLSSKNIPLKSNFKGHTGIEAMTGKGNFDISESIILKLLELLSIRKQGTLALLCKTSVIKNLLYDLPKTSIDVTTMEQYNFDSKAEFNVATSAALLLIKIGEKSKPSLKTSDVYDLYNPSKHIKTVGWIDDKFVSNVAKYKSNSNIDNKSPLTWRSGIKHDSSKIMELSIFPNNYLENGLKEMVNVESNLIYDLLKSSDLKKQNKVSQPRKKVIVTQSYVGQNTSFIKYEFPKLWEYLQNHRSYLDKRKSSIYKGKPQFSIFGVGDYSFTPYKVAISGMYKKASFSLILPIDDKPVMLDDTCYFLGFNNYNDALITYLILNSPSIQDLLESLVFPDAKRPYTKQVLMRIDLYQASQEVSFEALKNIAKELNVDSNTLTLKIYEEYAQKVLESPLSISEIDKNRLLSSFSIHRKKQLNIFE